MIKRMQVLFEQIVEKVENNPTAFPRYIQLFFAILFVRLALEFFSGSRLFIIQDVIHIGLWFIFIVLAFLLQLHLFSGVDIVKISKLVITFFIIALTAPIIDILIFGGSGAKMNYLSLNNWQQVVWSYITIGGANFSRGATPGIRIEIILLVIACFNYIRTKRKSIVSGIIGAWCIYSILFVSGAIPAILGIVVNMWKLQFQHDDQSTVLLLFSVDIFMFGFALYRYKPAYIFKTLKAIEYKSVILAVFYYSIGIKLSLENYPNNWNLTPTTLFWFPLLFGLFCCFVILSSLQKISAKSVSPDTMSRIKDVALVLIVCISLIISTNTFFTSMLIWSLLFMSFESPIQINKMPVLRHIIFGLLFISVALCGFCTFGAPMIGFPTHWMVALFINSVSYSLFVRLRLVGGEFYFLGKSQNRKFFVLYRTGMMVLFGISLLYIFYMLFYY